MNYHHTNDSTAVPCRPEVRHHNAPFRMVSVIIPVLNQERLIENCLKKLLEQNYPSDFLEIIVVDNGSKDKTLDIIRTFPVRLITENKKGPSAARNTGIKAAQGEILIFIDSDCVPDANFVKFHVEAHNYHNNRDKKVKLIAGGIAGYNATLWACCDDVCSWYNSHPNLSPRYEYNAMPTANMSVPADVIHEIGGFDEDIMGAEDILFCCKAKDNGYRIFFEPKAKVNHHNRHTFKGFIDHARMWAKNSMYIQGKKIIQSRDTITKIYKVSASLHSLNIRNLLNMFLLFALYLRNFFNSIWKTVKYSLISGRYHVLLLIPFILLHKIIFGFYTLKADINYGAGIKKQ